MERLTQQPERPVQGRNRTTCARAVGDVFRWGVDRGESQMGFHFETPELQTGKTKLWKVFGDARWDGCPLVYKYDFGDRWEHEIEVVGREAPTGWCVCKDGRGMVLLMMWFGVGRVSRGL
ncbi:uncharacterized protein BCR38DRAFT_482958 [Pseudomassariella vexata]|uniref:Plasmid pRiA4b Orf3-like domain-containing protein n=1 Tax=Pseudomassariella vexata TaxID=1141098 RepID=A0A1Y2E7C2_9PEZI|nr:uncharacterized protein BCR38DRAFT_482958 [Pseudomassariella vexata]ORY67337.1 hypothetical protein BCR38DRAFT_482958 [Pseudomassariella vexata]